MIAACKSGGLLPFANFNRIHAVPACNITDAEVAEAMRYAFSVLKLVVEPGGCVALTAALTGKIDLKGKTAAIVLSGGNVDPGLFAQVLQGEL